MNCHTCILLSMKYHKRTLFSHASPVCSDASNNGWHWHVYTYLLYIYSLTTFPWYSLVEATTEPHFHESQAQFVSLCWLDVSVDLDVSLLCRAETYLLDCKPFINKLGA